MKVNDKPALVSSGPALVVQKELRPQPAITMQSGGGYPTPAPAPRPTPAIAPRPTPAIAPTPELKAAMALELDVQETLVRLEPLIEKQLQQVREVLDAEGISPEDVKMVFGLDINGEQQVRCVFCGSPGCGFRPAAYAAKNVELDLLEDALVVFLEVAGRLQMSFGAMVVDEDVLVLREVDKPSNGPTTEETMKRYRTFRDRKTYPDSTSEKWMQDMLAKWTPAMATAKVVGESNDLGALKLGGILLERAEGNGPSGLLYAKSVAPKSSLRVQEKLLQQKGVQVTGVAVGKKAPQVAKDMFTDTDQARNPHALREKMGERMIALLEASQDAQT